MRFAIPVLLSEEIAMFILLRVLGALCLLIRSGRIMGKSFIKRIETNDEALFWVLFQKRMGYKVWGQN